MEPQLGPLLVISWSHLGTLFGLVGAMPYWSLYCASTGPHWSLMGHYWALSWATFEPLLGPLLGLTWSHLGAFLEPLLEPMLCPSDPRWCLVGAPLGAILEPLLGHLLGVCLSHIGASLGPPLDPNWGPWCASIWHDGALLWP